jgi:hypothetical protein
MNETDHGSGRDQIRLHQCPVQLQLIEPSAYHYQNADVVLAAACIVHAVKDAEHRLFQGKVVATACPKIDEAHARYESIIRIWCDESEIRSLTLMVMDIACCSALVGLVSNAMAGSVRKIPIKVLVIGLDGTPKQESVIGT